MNIAILIGRLTKDPELQYTPNTQTAVCKFTLAVDGKGKDEGADFIRITAFGKRAESISRYMKKGRQIAIQGKIQTGSYKDRDGKTVYTTDVILDDDEFLGSANSNETPRNPETTFEPAFSAVDDACPF